MKPALTAEEWRDEFYNRQQAAKWGSGTGPRIHRTLAPGADLAHQDAALALYGKPFGFTRADVARLRQSANRIRDEWGDSVTDLKDLADRIEALLPPETAC